MCDALATSDEHAPPLCMFPEGETFGRNLRKNLITVPSCDEHNNAKSQDDEHFRAVAIMTCAQNSAAAAKHQFFMKFMKAVEAAPSAFGSFFVEGDKLAGKSGVAVKINRQCFDASLDNMIRAIFYRGFRKKWKGPIHTVSPNFISGVSQGKVVPHEASVDASNMIMTLLSKEPVRGSNPEVFKYRIKYWPEIDAFAFACEFYDLFNLFSFASTRFVDSPSVEIPQEQRTNG